MAPAHVVVVGCGFGGLEATRALIRDGFEVTLIDRSNHHLFQPLLYQVATAGLSAPSISGAIRHVLRREMRSGRLTVLMGEVQGIDTASGCVVVDGRDRIAYDHLILATGATHSYFDRPDWAAHAPGLKTLADAFDIRRRVLLAFERAERHAARDGGVQPGDLAFAVVGAGPTGVEMAGVLAEIARHTLRGEYRRIDPHSARVVLLEGGPRVLPSFAGHLSARAQAQLEALGVEVLTGARVTAIDGQGLSYRDAGGERQLPARTVIWAAGVAASPLGAELARSTGCALDRAGRVLVEPDLSVREHPQISVIGDLAAATSRGPHGGLQPVPGVSPAAKQMGRCAAANIRRRVDGRPTQVFRYTDYGSLATIGRSSAVAAVAAPIIGKVQFSGLPAWLFWLFVHLYFLIGFRNRMLVLGDWAWAYFRFERRARVVIEAGLPVADEGAT